jgi:CubicO group peptidase (beta-lactamase class C family)
MAKIGYLYLNGGRWQGKQIVSEDWVKESIKNRVDARHFPVWHKDDGYGYQWWLRSFKVGDRVIPSYHAAGRGGQFIFVVPDLEMVAVITSWNDDELAVQPFEMLARYILPAAIALPAAVSIRNK